MNALPHGRATAPSRFILEPATRICVTSSQVVRVHQRPRANMKSPLIPRIRFAILTLILLSFTNTPALENTNAVAQGKPALSEIDRTRLAEAFQLADQIGDHVWPGWSNTPFAVLLVTPDYEFLLRHPQPSDDFAKLQYDTVLKSDVYYRKRTLPTTFLATF